MPMMLYFIYKLATEKWILTARCIKGAYALCSKIERMTEQTVNKIRRKSTDHGTRGHAELRYHGSFRVTRIGFVVESYRDRLAKCWVNQREPSWSRPADYPVRPNITLWRGSQGNTLTFFPILCDGGPMAPGTTQALAGGKGKSGWSLTVKRISAPCKRK
jgi:hypothetical protein